MYPSSDPATWHQFDSFSEITQTNPVTKRLLDRDLVGDIIASGDVAALAPRYSPMNANHGKGDAIDDWASSLPFVRSIFDRIATFPEVSTAPVSKKATQISITVQVRRSSARIRQLLNDAMQPKISGLFLRRPLDPDISHLDVVDFSADSPLAIDSHGRDYVEWVSGLPKVSA